MSGWAAPAAVRRAAHRRHARLNLRKAVRMAFYAGVRPVMAAALAATYRRVRRRASERFPRRGPVILVANHPAAWADVVALGALLGRPLHFLAHAYQFRPWPRRVVVSMWGTLPVYESDREAPDERNEETFRRCEALLEQGEVVAVFPEGVSRLDRGVMPLRLGAARLALTAAARSEGRSPVLIPVGLHFADRTAAGSDLTLSIGMPIPVPRLVTLDPSLLEAEAVRLTDRMREAIGSLIVDVPCPRLASLIRILEPVAAGNREALELEEARKLGAALGALFSERPADLERLERRAVEWERARAALGISPRALAGTDSRPERPRRVQALAVLGALLGAVPALAGAVLHIVPAVLGWASATRFRSVPQRIPFARMTAGLASWVLVMTAVWLAARALGGGGRESVAALLGGVLLALFAGEYGAWLAPPHERIRLALLERTRPDLVRRARERYEDLAADVRTLRAVATRRLPARGTGP